MGRPKTVCGSCQKELPRPTPHNCPHCGVTLSQVKSSLLPAIISLLLIVVLFAGLIWYVVVLTAD